MGAAKADAALALPSPARAGSEEGLSRFLSLPTLLITFHFHYTGKSSIANQLEKGKKQQHSMNSLLLEQLPSSQVALGILSLLCSTSLSQDAHSTLPLAHRQVLKRQVI